MQKSRKKNFKEKMSKYDVCAELNKQARDGAFDVARSTEQT